jgi:hypothetical protein
VPDDEMPAGWSSCLGCLGFTVVTLADWAAAGWAAASGFLWGVLAAGVLFWAILAAARRYRSDTKTAAPPAGEDNSRR